MSNVTVMKPRSGVTMEWTTVTPELATKWLEGNTHNRSVRDSDVHRYASDMRAGKWRQSHQGIAFDEQGTLIDGQHRLFAILEAEVSVLLMVTRGLPMETQLVVDDVIKRNVLDVLKIDGEPMAAITAMHTAVAMRMHYGLRTRTGETKQTRQEQIAFLKKHWEAIHFTVTQVPTRKRIARVTPGAMLGAVGRAYYYEDQALLTRFLQVLGTGLPQASGDETIIVLRNWLISRKVTAGDEIAREIYGKTLRTLVAFIKGTPIANGRLFALSEDPYPLPGTSVSVKTGTRNGKRK